MSNTSTPPSPPEGPTTDQVLTGFAILLACWLLGEVVSTLLPFALPGAVAGMLLLLAFCLIRRHVPKPIEAAGRGLLDHLSLLFVPAAVGLIDQGPLLSVHGPGLLATLVLSTGITMAITALTLKWLLGRRKAED
ncbi:CidA/LrgA family protein [Viridibacterium curvum]|uniref:CidA/LrgA family protein n=1 Tax=Viridibacterium curvum TaxID=1101404 RepID=A0ABP9R355_9RHOO